MAAPTFGAATNAQGLSTTISVGAPAGLVSGDFQVVQVFTGTGSEIIGATPAGWTKLGEVEGGASSANTFLYAVYYSTTAMGTFTLTKNGSRAWNVSRTSYKNHGGYRASSFTLQYNSASATTSAIPAKTVPAPESLVIAGSVQDHNDTGTAVTSTPPTGFTERVQTQGSSTNEWLAMTSADRATTTTNQAVSGNFTWTAAHDSAAWSLILSVGIVAIGPVTDSGVGTDTPSVSKTQVVNLTDSGVGTDTRTIDADAGSFTDAAVGTDTVAVEQLTDVVITDSGTGTDLIEVADFVGNDLPEVGTGSDTVDVVRTNFLALTDSGVGTDTPAVLRQLNTVTDAGLGTDRIVGLAQPTATDTGVGTDDLSVVVIPFTQVLLPKPVTVYDLVVVARVPQPSGPPQFIEIDPIEWKGLEYTNTLSQPQELSASCLLSSVTESILQRLRKLHDLATELWLYRDGTVVFAGPIQAWQTSGEALTIKAKGLLAYLRLMVVQADLRFAAADQFNVVKGLVDQWQNLEYGHFGIDTSSVGLSGVTRDAIYLRDELHNVGQRVEDLGKSATGFDCEVDPASRKLQLWSPMKGVNRADGEDAIVIDERNITSGDVVCSVALGDVASEAFGTGTSSGTDATLYSAKANLNLRARYGRTAWSQTYDAKTQADLDANTQGLLDARSESLLVPGPNVRVTPDADLPDYAVGDTIAYELGSTLGVSGAFRIRSQKVTASSTGQESVDLEFV